MAFGTTLGGAIVKVQQELTQSTNPALGQNFRARIIHAINAAQEFYFQDYEWDHLKGDQNNGLFEKLTAAGENLYDFPAYLDPVTANKAWVKWSNFWVPLAYGILQTDYDFIDADDDTQTLDPPQKWTRRSMSQFELWPRPASDGLPIRFAGKSQLTWISDEEDPLILEDSFVVLHAAGAVLENRDPKASAQKYAKAERLYRMYRHNLGRETKGNMAGGCAPDASDPSNKIFVGVVRG